MIFPLFECQQPPCGSSLVEGLCSTPDYAKAQALVFSSQANLRLQKANRIQDIAITGGYRLFNESRQHGWIIGAEFPLPLFNRNQGNVERACAEISQAENEMEEVMRGLKKKTYSSAMRK